MSVLQPKLAEAVKAEIDGIRKDFAQRRSLPPTELRKQGLSIFPMDCKESEVQTNGSVIKLRASFLINDTYFKSGSSVIVFANNQEFQARILYLDAQEIAIFTKEEIDFNPLDETFRIDFQPDDRTLRCMELGVELLSKKENLQRFQNDFYAEKPEIIPFTENNLNTSQQLAVAAILGNEPTVCIQGPPGTGKTTTLAIAIAELVKRGKQIIISAPSNTAVDNLVLRLLEQKIGVLRLGNEDKIHSAVLPYTIDGYLEKSSGKTIEHLRKELKKTLQTLSKNVRNYNAEAAAEKRTARNDLKTIKKDLRDIEQAEREKLMDTIPVLAGTPVALFNQLKKEKTGSVVVIDEAGQCLSPLAWLAASFGERLVLCGDPQQLPPTVQSRSAEKLGLGISLLEAVCAVQQPYLLQTQYRMSPEIVGAINPFFYDNKLETAPNQPSGKLIFVDMAGYGSGEQKDEFTGSTYNLDELGILEKVIGHFQLHPKQTVVLSPYSAQLEKAQQKLGKEWRISTIDSMQGQEAEQCVISLTRSNEDQDLGFLKDYRRTNVAISRAKTLSIIIGDSTTIGQDVFYSKLIEYAEQNGAYMSCWELDSLD